ncbi:MAG: tRNA uridine-5-carboxymethylaminomethyl(34) synthesis GTPase MnmE [Cellvibrionaceae bacterium]
MDNSTIVAIATASGRGGIGIIRLSGKDAKNIGELITQQTLQPRHAHHTPFYFNKGHSNKDHSNSNDKNKTQDSIIDEGIAIYFAGPHSFTGEDCVELQGHGGPVVMDLLVQTCLSHGARLAQPGEFSQRAFLNDKMDLAQAEAIADLINATSAQSARNAVNSLQGVFSKRVHELVEALIRLRIYVEAAIDFPEEEIDFLSDGKVETDFNHIRQQLDALLKESQQGVIVRDGIRVVIAGKPNAGKSSLLNALAERDTAIVTDIEGTTRDVLREHINIDGMPLHLVDTAGLRSNPDEVERIGIERAQQEFEIADRILLVVDSSQQKELSIDEILSESFNDDISNDLSRFLLDKQKLTLIANKTDLKKNNQSELIKDNINNIPVIPLSAKQGNGLNELKQHLKAIAGYTGVGESSFTARRRHLDALNRTQEHLDNGKATLQAGAGELLAEDLRNAQQALGEITGEFKSDDLLGRIFSNFCIGK